MKKSHKKTIVKPVKKTAQKALGRAKNAPKMHVKKSEVKVTKTSHTGHPKIMPLGSRVLIRPFTKEELSVKNSFGIILPESSSKEKSEQGEVIGVGAGEYRDGKLLAPQVKVGQKVAFSKYGYEDITVDGEELFLIKEENILAILK